MLPCPIDYPSTTDSEDTGTKDTTETVGKEWDSSLCFALTGERAFALTGERADDDLMIPRKCQATALATNINADVSQVKVLRALARRSKDRLFPWGCEGATWLDHEGYPYYHEEATTHLTLHSDNFHVVEDCAVAGAEDPRETIVDAASLNAQCNTLRVGSRENSVSARQAIVERLPEHMRCVLPDAGGDELTLTTSALDEATKLILSYEDCFVGASSKVCWTDQATHSIDTGVNRPVKQPPRRTSFVEKEQIERQLSDLLLEGKIQASESPWASPVLLIKNADGSWRFCIDYCG